MQKTLLVDYDKCTGCRNCEMYCSLLKTKTCNPDRSRVRVIALDEKGISAPVMCQQCEDAPCISACPVDAITKDTETGAVKIDLETCVGCEICIEECPFHAIIIDSVEEEVLTCDLCNGDPMCAKMCPTGTISFVVTDTATLAKKREAMEKLTSLARLVQAGISGGR